MRCNVSCYSPALNIFPPILLLTSPHPQLHTPTPPPQLQAHRAISSHFPARVPVSLLLLLLSDNSCAALAASMRQNGGGDGWMDG